LVIFSCRDDLSSSSICEIEETEDDSVTTRFYDIAISATDDAGNTGTKICSVIVVPDDHYIVDSIGKSGKISSVDSIGKSGKSSRVGHNPDDLREEYKLSTKRYVISELSLDWDPNLDTTLAIPPLPERDISSKAGKSSKSVFCSSEAASGATAKATATSHPRHHEEKGSKGSKSQGSFVEGFAPLEKGSKGSKSQGSSVEGFAPLALHAFPDPNIVYFDWSEDHLLAPLSFPTEHHV